jgi:translocation and assembly module TamB
MRNWRTIGKWIGGVAGAILLLLALLLYTPPGLALVARLVSPLSGGTVRVQGLGGLFPNRLHVAKLEVADAGGIWLTIDSASLRWSALAMLADHVSVQDISAARITVLRQPIPSGEAGGPTPRLDIENLSFPRVDLAAPVIGHAVTLTASGALHYTSLNQLKADLAVTRTDNADGYRIKGDITAGVAHGSATIREGTDGIVGKLAGFPGLGPINLTAQADGDATANRLFLSLAAGALQAKGRGTIQLAAQRADLDIMLAAPAMKPSQDIAWQSLSGEAHFHGRFDAPALQAKLAVTDGAFFGLTTEQLALNVDGDMGRARLEGSADKIRLPGEHPDLFAAAPVRFQAQADLKAPGRPITFAIAHPLAGLKGTAQTRGNTKLDADITIPSLAPFTALEKIDMRGTAGVHIAVAQAAKQLTIALNGKMDTQGGAIPAKLLGRNATLNLSAVLEGADLAQSRVQLRGAAIATDVEGSLRKGVLNYRLKLDLTDLSRLASTLQGTLSLNGSANGAMGSAALSVSGPAVLATKGFARQRINIDLQATGLPALRDARLTMDGRLDGAPLLLHAALKGDKTRQAALTARWKSLNAKADLAIGENSALSGKAVFALRQMSDIAVFTSSAFTGNANATVTLKPRGGKTDALLQADIGNLAVAGMGAKAVTLHGAVGDMMGKPVLGIAAAIQGLSAQGFGGDAKAQLDGPLDKLAASMNANLKDATGNPLNANAAVALNLPKKQVALNSLTGDWRGVALKLDAPATIDFANGLTVDHLAAHLGSGTIAASGRILPALSLTANARAIALQDFKSFLPQAGAEGTISASATLGGTIAAPQGTVSLEGRDLRAAFSSHSMPSAAFDARAQLAGDHATITASMTAGSNARLTLDGTAPLAPTGAMALHVGGTADLTLLDPFLAADGRRMRGALTLDAKIGGSYAAPRVTGSGTLAGGEFQDYARGVRLNDVAATVQADGARILLTQLTGKAGNGTISGSGSIDLSAPGMPVDMSLTAKDARPIASDLITATMSGDVKLTGHLRTAMTLAGKIQVTGGEINLPENFPPQVAVLNVRRRGEKRRPPPAPQGKTMLDIAVRTTGPIFVRGHGVEADMGGGVQVGGTSTAPVVSGGFRMNRGTFSVAGQTLDFTTGRVRFDGSGVRGGLDPTLDFVAQTVSGGVTATLTVGGYASAPKITLSSSPPLPQDEVVAHLLFQQSVKQLTPLQLASIAQAAASMGGIAGGFNPLGTVRRTLGLDRLSVGSANGGATGTQSQTTVEAGRYVSRNVYVGVKQNLSGGTQTQVQVDITRRLKAQATLSTGSTAATTQGNALQDNGSSVGLSYQFEY